MRCLYSDAKSADLNACSILTLSIAISIAGTLLTTECLVADLPEKKEKAPAMPGGMPGADMY